MPKPTGALSVLFWLTAEKSAKLCNVAIVDAIGFWWLALASNVLSVSPVKELHAALLNALVLVTTLAGSGGLNFIKRTL